MKKRLRWKQLLIKAGLLLILTELIFRFGFDLGSKALYVEDEYCEYKLAPNQNFTRFHATYITNNYGMRSGSVSKKDKKRVLLIGDSVLNGGSRIDQDDLLSTKLQVFLNNISKDQIGVYNISAGSWGPENAYQFVKNYVDFKFDMAILIFSSHDYNDNMHHRKVVGEQVPWPDKKPISAITDAFGNYFIPKLNSVLGTTADHYLNGFDDSEINPGWLAFNNLFKKSKIKYLTYIHPDKKELQNNSYNEKGKKLVHYLDSLDIPIINGLNYEKAANYSDNIHVTKESHLILADVMFNAILKNKLLDEN